MDRSPSLTLFIRVRVCVQHGACDGGAVIDNQDGAEGRGTNIF